jgi:uncharacterized membrane protein
MRQRRIIAGWSDERGAIAPFAAIALVAMIGLAALSTDLGSWVAQRRNLQAATDAAALAAVADQDNLENANEAALSTTANDLIALNRSSGSPAITASVDVGTYCADAATAPGSRFTEGREPARCPGDTRDEQYLKTNAARVDASSTAPTFLSRVLSPTPASFSIKTSATAARVDEAGFQAGTGLAEVDTQQSALLNAILGGLLGTQLQLSAVQYQGLLNTDIQVLDFLNALAKIKLSAGTYNQLLSTNVQVSQVLQAMINVLSQQSQLTNVALNALNSLIALQSKVTGNPALQLGQLIDLGVWQNEPVGGSTAPTALQAGVNVYQLLSMTLQVADGQHAIAIPNFDFSLLGLAAKVSLQATVIEPPQSPPFAFGPIGSSVHTAQVRLKLKVQLLTGLLEKLLGSVLNLPLYIEAGAGDATLTDIDCKPRTDIQSDIVTIRAESGIVRAYLGDISMDVMSNTTRPINYDTDVRRAPILDMRVAGILGLLNVSARAKVEIGRGSTDLKYTYPDIDDRVVKSGSSGDIVGSLLDSLTGLDADVCTVSLLGLCIGRLNSQDLTTLLNNIHSILDPIVKNLLDPLIDSLLVALGVKLGTIDVTVTGVRCGVPVLVQ